MSKEINVDNTQFAISSGKAVISYRGTTGKSLKQVVVKSVTAPVIDYFYFFMLILDVLIFPHITPSYFEFLCLLKHGIHSKGTVVI